MSHYGDTWRQQRKIAKQGLKPEAIHRFRPIQEFANVEYLKSLLEDPEHFISNLRLLVYLTPSSTPELTKGLVRLGESF